MERCCKPFSIWSEANIGYKGEVVPGWGGRSLLLFGARLALACHSRATRILFLWLVARLFDGFVRPVRRPAVQGEAILQEVVRIDLA